MGNIHCKIIVNLPKWTREEMQAKKLIKYINIWEVSLVIKLDVFLKWTREERQEKKLY